KRMITAALQSLATALGLSLQKVRSHLEQSFMSDWHSDPFSKGAYSYAPSGHLSAREALAHPVEDTLFFAGEATHTGGFSGTVHGAIATGRRAARDVLASLSRSRDAA